MINDDDGDDEGDSSHENSSNDESEPGHEVELVPRAMGRRGEFGWVSANRYEELQERIYAMELLEAERRGEARAGRRVEQLTKWTLGAGLAIATLMVASAGLAWNARHVIKRVAVAAWGDDSRPKPPEAHKQAPSPPAGSERPATQLVFTVRSVHDTVCRIAGSTRGANVLIARYSIPVKYLSDGTVVAVVYIGQTFIRPLPHESVTQRWVNCGERS